VDATKNPKIGELPKWWVGVLSSVDTLVFFVGQVIPSGLSPMFS
jgi:hypothetical protein